MSRTDDVDASDVCAACLNRDVLVDDEPCRECWSHWVSTGTLNHFTPREVE